MTEQDFNRWCSIIRTTMPLSKYLTLTELNRKIKLVEGIDIPFKKFNFRTLEDMLRRVSGLNVFEEDGKAVIEVAPILDSEGNSTNPRKNFAGPQNILPKRTRTKPNYSSSLQKKKSDSNTVTEEITSNPTEILLSDFLPSNIENQCLENNVVHQLPTIGNTQMCWSYSSIVANENLLPFSTGGDYPLHGSWFIPESEISNVYENINMNVAFHDFYNIQSPINSVDECSYESKTQLEKCLEHLLFLNQVKHQECTNKESPRESSQESCTEISDQFNKWSAIIRDLVLSSKRISMWKLNRTAEMLEGESIPFKQLNFNTLEDMIQKISGLEISDYNGKPIVQAIPTEEEGKMPKSIKVKRPKKKRRIRNRVIEDSCHADGST